MNKKLVLVDRVEGYGTVENETVEPEPVRFEIEVKQWVYEPGGERGTHKIDGHLDFQRGMSSLMTRFQLLDSDDHATLTNKNGRKLKIRVFVGGGSGSRSKIHVESDPEEVLKFNS